MSDFMDLLLENLREKQSFFERCLPKDLVVNQNDEDVLLRDPASVEGGGEGRWLSTSHFPYRPHELSDRSDILDIRPDHLSIFRTSDDSMAVAAPDLVLLGYEETAAPYWKTNGWVCSGLGRKKRYSGSYQAARQAIPGNITAVGGRVRDVVLNQKPNALRFHPKSPCFFAKAMGSGVRVHFDRRPATVDQAILYVERILSEAYELEGRR